MGTISRLPAACSQVRRALRAEFRRRTVDAAVRLPPWSSELDARTPDGRPDAAAVTTRHNRC